MEVAKLLHSPFLILLLVFLVNEVSSSVDADNGRRYEKIRLNLHKEYSWMHMKNAVQANCIFQRPRAEEGTTTLEMKRRDYCSGKVSNWEENIKLRLHEDAIHVEYLQSQINSAFFSDLFHESSQSQLPVSSGDRVGTFQYIVTIGIGNQNFTLTMDTGSDLTWVQSTPCSTCYPQQEPLYNPSKSPSFRSLPCNSPTCSRHRSETGSSGLCPNTTSVKPCDYQIVYGDGSYTRGDLAYETLKLGNISVPNFLFGCGRDNKGIFGEDSGMLGLSRTELSLISQTSSIFCGIFSYCLPSQQFGGSGSLTLGKTSFSNLKNVTPISYARMLYKPELPNYYLLNLTGIKIGDVKLDTPYLNSTNRGLSMVDSGTVITRMAKSVYRAFNKEFKKQFTGFKPAGEHEILKTCYNLTGMGKVSIPSVAFQFEGGGEMKMDAEGIFIPIPTDQSQVCLAFAGSSSDDHLFIIGNYQQQNQRVIFDPKHSKLGFAQEPCGF